jgi:hypothetical protein
MRYSSYSFSTSALDEGEWSASHPGHASAPGKGPLVPIVQEAGWASEPVWAQRAEEKSFRLCRGSNPDRPVVQPVVRINTLLAWKICSLLPLITNQRRNWHKHNQLFSLRHCQFQHRCSLLNSKQICLFWVSSSSNSKRVIYIYTV